MVNKLKTLSSLTMLLIFIAVVNGQHFTPAYLAHSDNPYLTMNFSVTAATLDGTALAVGDSIGIFAGNTCVGASVVSGTISAPDNMLAILASAQDEGWPAGTGFTADSTISYHYWDASAGKETIQVTPTYLEGDSVFTFQGSVYISLAGTSCEASSQLTCPDGSCVADLATCSGAVPGCTDVAACNYNSAATTHDGSCVSIDGICQTCVNGVIINNDADNDGTCNSAEITGCMDDHACNYNNQAEFDNGTCAGACDTCDDSGNVIVGETNADGSCLSIGYMGSNIPTAFAILQNYPNPFNPITKITYALPENSMIQIEVIDLSGKRVQTLINEFQTWGYYSVNWDASAQSSGVYFVKMIAGETIKTKKIILAK